jgi:tripartite-type tricarboxylate transporter receptor subunit TctC
MNNAFLLLASTAVLWTSGTTLAQSYPSKPVRIVVPYPPGGGNDTLARIFGAKLTDAWGQQFIIDNRPGAGTTLGTALVARAVPDGYTLLLSSIATHAIAPSLYANPGYEPIRDFSPITILAIAPTVLCVNPAMAVKSVRELVEAAKARPGELKFGSGGNGTPPHMAGVIFAEQTGVRLLHVPYKGGGAAQIGLIGGEVNMMFDPAASILPQVKAGKLRALALGRSARLPEYPDIPTFVEAGVPAFEVNAWYSMHAPANVPATIIKSLNNQIVRIIKLADVQERLKQLGSDGVGNTPEAFQQFVRAEREKYATAIKASGTRVE